MVTPAPALPGGGSPASAISATSSEPTPDWSLDGHPNRTPTGSFFRRVFLWILGMSMIMSVGSSAVFYTREMKYLQADLERRAQTLISTLATQADLGVYARDRGLLHAAAQRVMGESDVIYVALYDARAEELVRKGAVPAPSQGVLAELLRSAPSSAAPVTPVSIVDTQGGFVDRYAPIVLSARDAVDSAYAQISDEGSRPTPIGVARVGISLQPGAERLAEVVRFGALLALSLLLLGAAAAYFIAGKLSVPILALARGADAIRNGNLHPKIVVKGQDEVGILADSFLRMAARLRQTMDALSTLNRNLEEEVGRRTRQLQHAYEFTSMLNAPIDRRSTDPGRLDAADMRAMLERSLQALCEATSVRAGGVFLPADDDEAEAAREPERPLLLRVSYSLPAALPASAGSHQRLLPAPTRAQLQPQVGGPHSSGMTPTPDPKDRTTAPAMVVLPGGRLALPLSFRDQILGALVLVLPPGESGAAVADSATVAFARQAAAQLAIAVSNAQAYARAAQLAYELTERNSVLAAQRDQMRAQRDQLELQRNQLELQSMQLRAQRNQLQEVNRLKSEFLASVSHELRTPLNAIMGYAELVSEGVYGPVTTEAREALGGVLESSTNLLNLINQILDLARVEAGKMEMFLERVDVHDVATGVIKVADAMCRDRPYRVTLTCPSGEDRPVLQSDRVKLRQILTNLLANAVKFTPAGSVELRITEEATDEGPWLRCEVIDSGIGIRKEHQSIIFEEFRQVDGSSTRRFGGTGLGLAIARRMTELLGGTLTVHSEYGVGSTFTLRLPFTAPPPQQTEDIRS